jgi:hypothetical protein
MIKWIKSLIEKVFGKKEEPIILEDEPKQEEVKEIITTEPEKIQCNTHSRFKKSCPLCVEAAK